MLCVCERTREKVLEISLKQGAKPLTREGMKRAVRKKETAPVLPAKTNGIHIVI